MKAIKNVFSLYKTDWKRVFKNKLTLVLVIALMIIPSLYAWFNIAALWDPYSNTKDIKIAIFSEDKSAEVFDKSINIGDEMLKNLKDNHTLDWQFVSSKKELDQGVKEGKYFAGITLPKDFSKNLISFVSGDIKKPTIDYQVNQKINAIAPKITEKGASTIQTTITTEFIDTVTKTVFETLNDVGYNVDENLVSINKVTSKVLSIEAHLDDIDGYTKDIVNLNEKFPAYKEKLNKANKLVDYLPEVDKLGDKLVKVNEAMPEIDKAGKLLIDLQGKTGDIKNAGRQIKQVDEDFDEIVKTINQAVDTSKEGLVIIEEAQQALPEVEKIIGQANDTLPTVIGDIEKIQQALPQVATGISSSIKIVSIVSKNVSQTSDSLNQFMTDNDITEADKAELGQLLEKLDKQLVMQENVLTSLIDSMESLQEMAGATSLQPHIDHLKKVRAVVNKTHESVQATIKLLNNLTIEQLHERLTTITNLSNQINDKVNGINVEELENHVSTLLKKVDELLGTVNGLTNKIAGEDLLKNVDKLLTKTTQTIQAALGFFDKYQSDLPLIKKEIHQANVMLNGNMDTIIGGIDKGVAIYKNDFPELKNKLNKGLEFYQKDWPNLEKQLTSTLKTVNDKMPEIESALQTTTDFINNEWPDVKVGIGKVSDLIRKGQDDVDLGAFIKLLKSDANDESDFLSNPIELKEQDVYPVPNYGSASAPFYTALCLWVGAVLFSSIATTDVFIDEKTARKKKYSKREKFFARMLTFLTVGFFQSLIVSLGNIWLLNTYTVNPVWSVLFAILVGMVFMTIVYVLVGLLGNLGKGIAVIILVLSISGGGGNFPIEMSGPFFQMIHPLIPFTYAVNLLRESTGGIYWPNARTYLIVLLGFGIAFLVLGYVLAPSVKSFFKKLNDKLKEGHLLH